MEVPPLRPGRGAPGAEPSIPLPYPMKIGIVGAGKVGGTIATLLESCKFCRSVALADTRANIDLSGLKKSRFVQLDVHKAAQLPAVVKGVDAVVSAAPYFLSRTIATACVKAGVIYFD